MSIRVMTAVWSDSAARGGELLVLLAIADFAHDNGVAFPSVPTLAVKARLTARQVTDILKKLQGRGELDVKTGQGPKGTNLYRVLVGTVDTTMKPLQGGDEGSNREGMKPTSYEPSGTVRKSSAAAAPRYSKAERDAIWEALEAVTGITPESLGERSRFGKMVNQLLDLGASPDEVRTRARRWPMRYPGATLTDTALVNRWGELSGKKSKAAQQWQCDVPSCGLIFSSAAKKQDHMRNVHDAA